ncbi:MAG: response regulator [Deltaproteobacteria bacterium]|jgi:two-component system, chemotaxis family, chemotaxis protein CheY|nr:response regulator [Deltaproteobacteria bacterium]
MKILIVEDNASNFLLLQKLLVQYGAVDNAIDGESAMNKFISAHQKNQPFDTIFLDIIMPKKDGSEVLTEIRAWEKQNSEVINKVQIVMTTSISDTDTVMKSYSDGCQHYLLKPYNKTDIHELMVRMGFTEKLSNRN